MTKVHGKRYAYKFDFQGLAAATQPTATDPAYKYQSDLFMTPYHHGTKLTSFMNPHHGIASSSCKSFSKHFNCKPHFIAVWCTQFLWTNLQNHIREHQFCKAKSRFSKSILVDVGFGPVQVWSIFRYFFGNFDAKIVVKLAINMMPHGWNAPGIWKTPGICRHINEPKALSNLVLLKYLHFSWNTNK